MHKETFWFSHDYNARSDRKLLKLRMTHKMEGIGVYWCIVEMLYEESGYLNHSEYGRIAYELQTNENLVASIVNDFGLFDKNDENFWSDSVINRLKIRKDKSDQSKEAVRIRWERERLKKKKDTDVLRTYNGSNTTKDKKGYDKIESNNSLVKHDENKKINGTEEVGINSITSGEGILAARITAKLKEANGN